MRVRLWLLVVVYVVSRHMGVAAVDETPPNPTPNGEAVGDAPAVVADTSRARAGAKARVAVRVYSSTDLATDAQRASLDVARATFAAAAIQLVWKICGQVACDTSLSDGELAVRMVQFSSGGRRGDRHLGEALIDPQKRIGVLATVYVNRTLGLARELEIDHAVLLGRTIAHEIGHLLLATNEHAVAGLMREVWSRDQLVRTRRNDWILLPPDAAAILERLASRSDRPRLTS
jgi:hypothetical protein